MICLLHKLSEVLKLTCIFLSASVPPTSTEITELETTAVGQTEETTQSVQELYYTLIVSFKFRSPSFD